MSLRAARPSGEPSIASPIVPTALAAPWPARPSAEGSAGWTASSGSSASAIAASRTASRAASISLGPAAVEGGQRDVVAALGERLEVAQQRRDVLGVEHREAQRLVALEHEVGGDVAQAGELGADALRGREAVEVVLGRLLGQLAARGRGLARRRRAAARRARRRGGRQARPVARELAAGGVQLAQGAMLGGVEAGLAQRYRPGSHSGSSPALAARERMKSRSERRLR